MLSILRGILFQSTYLAPYMPLLAQTTQQKVIRLMKDKSNPKVYLHDYYNQNVKQMNKNFISVLFFNKIQVINPINTFMMFWYILVLLALLYYYIQFSLVLFYQGAWQDQLTSSLTLGFSLFFLLILIIDSVLLANTGYLKRGVIILDRKRVIKHYLRKNFIIDFSYIVIIILSLATGQININWGKFLWFLKIIRLIQIDSFFMMKFNVEIYKKTIYVILKMVLIILLVSHCIGVIFYIMDNYFLQSGYYESEFCWLTSSTSYSPISSLSYGWQYFYSLYWGINTITNISYGDISPLNPLEIVYATFMFCFGFMVFGYVVNQIIKIIIWAKGHRDKLRQDIVVMDVYMDKLKISPNVKQEVKHHLQFLHKQQKNRNINLQKKMRNRLPQDLRYQLVVNAYASMNIKIKNIFKTSNATKFLFYLDQKKYTNNQLLSYQGQHQTNLNYLHKGLIHLIVSYNNREQKIYESNPQNQFLGHYQLFSRRKSPYSIVSKAGSIVYSINRQKIFQLVNKVQQIRQKFKQVQYEVIFKNNLSRIFYSCYYCKENHNWNQCKDNFVLRKKQNNHYSTYFDSKNGQKYRFNGQIRVIRRKYHTLKDKAELKIFKNIRNISNKKLVNTIEKNIARIKQKINQKKQQMDLDIAFDWKYYDMQENFSKKKQAWNKKVQQNILKKSKNLQYSARRIRQNVQNSQISIFFKKNQ